MSVVFKMVFRVFSCCVIVVWFSFSVCVVIVKCLLCVMVRNR